MNDVEDFVVDPYYDFYGEVSIEVSEDERGKKVEAQENISASIAKDDDTLSQRMDHLHHIITDWDGIVVAGGYVLNSLIGDEKSAKEGDIDIWFVAPDVEVSREESIEFMMDVVIYDKVIEIRSNVMKYAEYYAGIHGLDVSYVTIESYVPTNFFYIQFQAFYNPPEQNGNKVQLVPTVQIILKKTFRNVEALLDRFDLNCVQFAWNGEKLFTTEESIMYLQDMTVRRLQHQNTTMIRLLKYLSRPYNTGGPLFHRVNMDSEKVENDSRVVFVGPGRDELVWNDGHNRRLFVKILDFAQFKEDMSFHQDTDIYPDGATPIQLDGPDGEGIDWFLESLRYQMSFPYNAFNTLVYKEPHN